MMFARRVLHPAIGTRFSKVHTDESSAHRRRRLRRSHLAEALLAQGHRVW